MTRIYEANNHIIIRAEYADPIEHRHTAAHILIALDGDLRVCTDGAETVCRGVMIPAGISHKVDTGGKPALVFLYDCTSAVAEQIRELRILPGPDCNAIISAYLAFEQNVTADSYCRFEADYLSRLGLPSAGCRRLDERIAFAMAYIRKQAVGQISCQEVADAVCLSQSRFSHLFREQVGMTFAAYRIYQRILYVYAGVLQGKSVTEAALNAGFSGSAHFADVNRRVFGLSVSRITKNVMFCKVG